MFFLSCNRDKESDNDVVDIECGISGDVEFVAHVLPIIQKDCLGCHNNSVMNGNVNLEGYENIKLHSEIKRNDISVVIGTIKFMDGFSPMPPYGKMNDCDIRKIELWIDQGMQNN